MNTHPRSRRTFLGFAAMGAAGLTGGIWTPADALAQSQGQSGGVPATQPAARPPRPPRLAAELVEEFVRAAHVNLERTKELLAQEPALLNATWDWGAGDWETGLGGASHMGNRDIAVFLIGQGARMDIFAAAMLGRVEVVRNMLDAFPNLLHSKGPHGIPLLAHAKRGGDEAAGVVALLESLGVQG